MRDKNETLAPPVEEKKDLVRQMEPWKPTWPTGLMLSKPGRPSCYLPEDLQVILTKEAFEQLFGYAYATNREISCLGVVKRQGNLFIVERFHLVAQEGTGSHTEMDSVAIANLMEDLLQKGEAQEARSIKCWAHSHPGMGVFWSKTDDNTCRLLTTDYLVSLVVSDGFAIRCRVDVANPIPYSVDNVPVLYEATCDNERLDSYAKEVAQKVKERSPFPADPFGTEEKNPQLLDNDPWSEYFGSAYSLFDGEETAELDTLRDDSGTLMEEEDHA
jgi:proteasome lid subunit RPN8/RPN11